MLILELPTVGGPEGEWASLRRANWLLGAYFRAFLDQLGSDSRSA